MATDKELTDLLDSTGTYDPVSANELQNMKDWLAESISIDESEEITANDLLDSWDRYSNEQTIAMKRREYKPTVNDRALRE